MTVLGAIIAGGQSRRFGSDKALAMLGGTRLIDHVIDGLQSQVEKLVICGRVVSGTNCLDDWPSAGLGPLGGLAAALRHALVLGHEGVLTSACDTPLVPPDLRHRLEGPGPAVVSGQPLFGYWPASLFNALDQFLQQPDNRSVEHWATVASAVKIDYHANIPNLNTRDELNQLHKVMKLECPR